MTFERQLISKDPMIQFSKFDVRRNSKVLIQKIFCEEKLNGLTY